jgi:hypothetical protein
MCYNAGERNHDSPLHGPPCGFFLAGGKMRQSTPIHETYVATRQKVLRSPPQDDTRGRDADGVGSHRVCCFTYCGWVDVYEFARKALERNASVLIEGSAAHPALLTLDTPATWSLGQQDDWRMSRKHRPTERPTAKMISHPALGRGALSWVGS